jgi:hypothetical protein
VRIIGWRRHNFIKRCGTAPHSFIHVPSSLSLLEVHYYFIFPLPLHQHAQLHNKKTNLLNILSSVQNNNVFDENKI